eukprot:3807882-Alexandrium_andersonii.AAC.1
MDARFVSRPTMCMNEYCAGKRGRRLRTRKRGPQACQLGAWAKQRPAGASRSVDVYSGSV